MPVPIEAIIEFQFHIDIVPVPGLGQAHEVESAITNDFQTIYVDEYVFKKVPRRYRYSLAHELSHKLIHPEIFAGLRFASLAELKASITTIPGDEYNWIEHQAYNLAGLLLVPSPILEAEYTAADTAASNAGISLCDLDAKALKSVCHSIGSKFEVSADVIRKRLKYDKLLG